MTLHRVLQWELISYFKLTKDPMGKLAGGWVVYCILDKSHSVIMRLYNYGPFDSSGNTHVM